MDGRIENTGHLILALHPPYHLILWDTSLGTKVWKKSYDTVSIYTSGTANENPFFVLAQLSEGYINDEFNAAAFNILLIPKIGKNDKISE